MSTSFALTAPSIDRDRQQILGGSDVAAILGISPWKTPYQLWCEKTGAPAQIEDDPEREKRLRRGKRLEPWVIEMLQEERDVWIAERSVVHVDSEYPWMRAEIDFEYVIDQQAPLEPSNIGNGDVKTVSPFNAKEWGEQQTDEIPLYYAAQFQWGMMVAKRKTCLVAALIGADDLRVYRVHRDEELIAEIRRRAIRFWEENVLGGVTPPPQSSDDARKLLAHYGTKIEADESLAQKVADFRQAKLAAAESEKAAAAQQEAIEISIADAFRRTGKSEDTGKISVEFGGKSILTWNLQSSRRLNQKRLAGEMPDVVARFTEPSTYRVLRIGKEN